MFQELNLLSLISLIFFCFFLGSIPFDRLVFRKKSRSWFLLAVVFNTLKGSLAVIVGSMSTQDASLITSWTLGFFAFLGDYYCPWVPLGQRKALHVAWGVFLILAPWAAMMGMLGFFCAYFYKRIIAFASITGLILTAASYFVMHPKGVYLWIVVGFIFFILARYEKDIDRLLIQEGS